MIRVASAATVLLLSACLGGSPKGPEHRIVQIPDALPADAQITWTLDGPVAPLGLVEAGQRHLAKQLADVGPARVRIRTAGTSAVTIAAESRKKSVSLLDACVDAGSADVTGLHTLKLGLVDGEWVAYELDTGDVDPARNDTACQQFIATG